MFWDAAKKSFDILIFCAIYISICAAAMAWQMAYVFALPHNFNFYGFVFCGTLCSYNTHYALTPKLFQNPMPQSTGLNRMPLWLHVVLAVAGLLGAFYFFFLLSHHWLWLVLAAALSFLYTAPKIPLRVTQTLQKIAYGKTVFLTLAWTYITAVLPLLIADVPLQNRHILFAVNRFFLIYSICILFDLRDRESDQKQGIKSMITQAPLPAVDRIYWGSLVVFFGTATALLLYFSAPVVTAFVLPGLVLLMGYSWFKKQTAPLVYNLLLDGLMVISLPLLLLFRI